MLQWRLLVLFAFSALSVRADPAFDQPTFHGDRERTGWNAAETVLTPAAVGSNVFGKLWDSPQLDSASTVDGSYLPHIYAAPLYLDDLTITAGRYAGKHFRAIITATSSNFVYAIAAFPSGSVAAGTILWRRCLGGASLGADSVPVGVLATPVADLASSRLYVAADVADPTRSWRVFALDLGSGAILSGWPLEINDETVNPINENGPATFQPAGKMSQRGALNLSLDRSILYVPFGSYVDGGAGWLVAVDTGLASGAPRLLSAFSGGPWIDPTANAGMWSASGPAIDGAGVVYLTTGNSPTGPRDRTWGNSIVAFAPSVPLRLLATYTPWNHCQLDDYDVDMAGGGPTVLPDLDPRQTLTPRLLASGGKQGNAYLLDRDRLGGRLDRRPDCNTSNPGADTSLLGPDLFSYYGNQAGPLNLFGPYSEEYNNVSKAKSRSTPAYFRAADGTSYLFFAGTTKKCAACMEPVPPGLARVRVVTSPTEPAYLTLEAYEQTITFVNPGSPIVSSNGGATPVVWIVDANVDRAAPLTPSITPNAILYAIDALTMRVLYASGANDLHVGGKYYHPVVARGVVFVGTDRIAAFGLTGELPDAGTPDAGPPDAGARDAGIVDAGRPDPVAGADAGGGGSATTLRPLTGSGCASAGAGPACLAAFAWLLTRRRGRK